VRAHIAPLIDAGCRLWNNPPPFNILALPKTDGYNKAANQLMAVLDKYGSFDDTKRVGPTLWAALMTLWHEDKATIRDVSRLFRDVDYRNRLLDKLDNPAVEDFWTDFESRTDGQQDQRILPVLDRMRDFYSNNFMYPIMCHPEALDYARLIREQKIILISLGVEEGKLPPQDQRLLGALLVFQLQMAVMGGAAQASGYKLYIDEVQHFVTTPLDEMFSEVRKYNLSLTIANQYLKQLAGNTLEAIMGNVGAMVVFQCGLDDARSLGPYLKPGFEMEDLLNFDKFNAAAYMRFNGQQQPAFSLHTRQPLPSNNRSDQETAQERERRIRDLSISNYTPHSRQEILDWLKKRYPRVSREKPQGSDLNPHLYDPN